MATVYYRVIEPDMDTDDDVSEAMQQFAQFVSQAEQIAESQDSRLISTGEPLDAWRRRTGRWSLSNSSQ